MSNIQDEFHMRQAICLAQQAWDQGEVPVGAVLIKDDRIIGRGFNQPISTCDPTAHAEIIALREAASAIQNYRLVDTTLYVTLEPCLMCWGAIFHARVSRVVFGAKENYGQSRGSSTTEIALHSFSRSIDIKGGILGDQCSHQLKSFFKQKRQK